MRAQARRMAALGAAGIAVACAAAPADADRIRLKDGTEFSGRLVQKDAERVMVEVARASIEAIDGQLLPPPITAGAEAPTFEAVDLNGVTHALADYRGQVTLLQFWASWCPHCRSDLSLVKDLAGRYRGKGLQVLAVSIDNDLQALRAFLSRDPLPYPVISASGTPGLAELYEMQGVPAYYVIDRSGRIAKTWMGSVTERPSDLEEVLARLLAPAGT